MSNLELWNKLGKTDPAHTKPFNRPGGFRGTAVKPQWTFKRLTEEFGPVGVGWGIERPLFETVHTQDGEVLVYCTVQCWHGKQENSFFGVGGDKAVAKRSSGMFSDDEAYKKAFTDAVGNAFKFLGVAADIHMGQFDDSKYVEQVAQDFAEEKKKPVKLDGPYTSKTALWAAFKKLDREIRGCGDSGELEPLLALQSTTDLIAQCERDAPNLLDGGEGLPPEFVPLNKLITDMRKAFEASDMLQAG